MTQTVREDDEPANMNEIMLNCYPIPTSNSVSMTQSIAKLTAALVNVQRDIKAAPKDSNNPHFKSRYAGLLSVWETAKAVLPANGLAVMQFPTSDGPTVSCTTILSHTSGEYVVATLTMTAQQTSPQGIGSTITYARRYGLSAILSIVADEDDDGNQGSAGDHRPKNSVTGEQLEAIKDAADAAGVNADDIAQEKYGIPVLEMMVGQAQQLLGHLKTLKPKPKNTITEEQGQILKNLLQDCRVPVDTFKDFAYRFKVKKLGELKTRDMIAATEWLEAVLAQEAKADPTPDAGGIGFD